MRPFHWLANCFSSRGKASFLYKRGLARARKLDHWGAIDHYTAAIEMEAIPTDVKALALFNRALAFAAAGDHSKGVDDLNMILDMDDTLRVLNIKTMARQRLLSIQS